MKSLKAYSHFFIFPLNYIYLIFSWNTIVTWENQFWCMLPSGWVDFLSPVPFIFVQIVTKNIFQLSSIFSHMWSDIWNLNEVNWGKINSRFDPNYDKRFRISFGITKTIWYFWIKEKIIINWASKNST